MFSKEEKNEMRGDGEVEKVSGREKQVDGHKVRVRAGVWLLANWEFVQTASTSGLIPECCPVGEEGPHWCLPARFYSRPSILMWASHRPLLLLLAVHHSFCPPIKYLSNMSVCVFGCFRSPAGYVDSGRRGRNKKRERSFGSQSHGSSLAWLSLGASMPLGKTHKICTKTHCSLSPPHPL